MALAIFEDREDDVRSIADVGEGWGCAFDDLVLGVSMTLVQRRFGLYEREEETPG